MPLGCKWDPWPCGSWSGCPLLRGCPASHSKENGPHWSGGWDHRRRGYELLGCNNGWLQGKDLSNSYNHLTNQMWGNCIQKLKTLICHRLLPNSGLLARATHLPWERQLWRCPTSTGRISVALMMSRESCRSWCRYWAHKSCSYFGQQNVFTAIF